MLGAELPATEGAPECAALGVKLVSTEGTALRGTLGEAEPIVLGAELPATEGELECAELGEMLD